MPMVVALFAVPRIIDRFGEAGFGAFSLAWIVVGAAMMLDFGLARSLTHWTASAVAVGRVSRSTVLSVSSFVVLVLGIIGVVAALALGTMRGPAAAFIDRSAIAHPGFLTALPWILAAVPVNVCLAGLIAIGEGFEAFVRLNLLRAPFTILGYVVPLLVVDGPGIWTRLFRDLFFVRLGQLLVLAVLVWFLVRAYRPRVVAEDESVAREVKALARLSIWLAASALTAVAFTYADRLALGLYATATAVALYQTPFDVLSRALVVPTGVGSFLYPRMSRLGLATSAWRFEVDRSGAILIWLFGAPLLLLSAVVEPALSWWINADFGARAAPIAGVLTAGVILNGMARVPVALLQATGRPEVPVKVALIESVPFFAAMFAAASFAGVAGVAAVVLVRSGIDLWLLTVACRGSAPRAISTVSWPAALATVQSAFVLACLLVDSMQVRLLLAALGAVGTSIAAASMRRRGQEAWR